jgi:hypothetical protein
MFRAQSLSRQNRQTSSQSSMHASNSTWRHSFSIPINFKLKAHFEWFWFAVLFCIFLCFRAKMFRNFIGGLFFVILMFLTTFFGAIFMMGPTLPLLFFKPSWFRYVSDKLMGTWLGLPVVSILNRNYIVVHFNELCTCVFLINFPSYCFNTWFSCTN